MKRSPALFARTITSARKPLRDLRTRPANECAQCGEPIFMPEWSEWLNPACARHLWQCEACGYSFETTVKFAAA
jgi:ribosomal protein S27AE